jgi:hypothetical protein
MRRVKASSTAALPLLALVGLLTACSSGYSVQRPVAQSVVEQLESDGLSKGAKVHFSVPPAHRAVSPSTSTAPEEGQTLWVRGEIEGVNLRELKLWIPGHGQRRIPYGDIQRIQITNHTLGLAEGLSGGVLGGVVVGGFLAVLDTGMGCTGHYESGAYPSTSSRLLALGMTCGILGGSFGALLGVLLGHRTTFTF